MTVLNISLTVEWWHWLVLGLVLIGLELTLPTGFYVIFFGVGALIVGVLAVTGVAQPLWLQVLLFTVISLATLAAFRGSLVARMRANPANDPVDNLVGETAVALEDLATDTVGKAELRGSSWNARNVGERTVPRGAQCTVLQVDGLTLLVAAA